MRRRRIHPRMAFRCCARCSLSIQMIPRRGRSMMSTCLDRICWSRRCSKLVTDVKSICRRERGSIIRPARFTKEPSGTTSLRDQIPVVLLVKDHSVLPHIKVAQSTSEMDWNNVELKVFSSDNGPVTGWYTAPQLDLIPLTLEGSAHGYALKSDPLAGKVKWQVTTRRRTLIGNVALTYTRSGR